MMYDFETLKKQVWETEYLIKTRFKFTFSDDDYEERGIRVTGDPEADFWAMEEWITTTRCIADLAEMHNEGKEFYFCDNHVLPEIFRIINDYTQYVAEAINGSAYLANFGIKDNPKVREIIEDIVKLQNLGNRVYPLIAEYQPEKPKEEAQGLLAFIQEANKDFAYIPQFDFDINERLGSTFISSFDEEPSLQSVYEDQGIGWNKEQGFYNIIDINRELESTVKDKMSKYWEY